MWALAILMIIPLVFCNDGVNGQLLPPPMKTNPAVVGAAPDCCNTLLLKSSGGMAQGMQKHLLGQYFRDDSHDGEEGTMVYKQARKWLFTSHTTCKK